jgi:chromatin remodeling complex protein RSC6
MSPKRNAKNASQPAEMTPEPAEATPEPTEMTPEPAEATPEPESPEQATDAMSVLLREMQGMGEVVAALAASVKLLDASLKKSAKLVAKASRRKRGGGAKTDPNAPKRETNLTKKLKITPEMAEFLEKSEPEASRTDIVKKISDYSKTNKLKLETDKRVIVLDETLAKLLEMEAGANVRFCDVQKHIKHHIISPVS